MNEEAIFSPQSAKNKSNKTSALNKTNKNVSIIINNTSKINIENNLPEKLQLYISQELWKSFSPIRQDSFKKIFQNPNTFFYRNRVPGEEQKIGPFQPDEKAKFLDRLKYFHETLKIHEGLWGLFAVPISGRLGYQCSNYYRQLIMQGEITDPCYSFNSSGKLEFNSSKIKPRKESISILEKEAFDYINYIFSKNNEFSSNIRNSYTNSISIHKPIPTNSSNHNKTTIKTTHKNSENIHTPSKQEKSNKNVKTFKEKTTTQLLPDENPIESIKNVIQSVYRSYREKLKQDSERIISPPSEESSDDESSPIQYATDPITGIPMLIPMLDVSARIVLDATTWEMYFQNKLSIPYRIYAQTKSDLISINKKTFKQYRYCIDNVLF